ncbi:hypothetical protein [Pontibacter mangrovi]|uniref:Uncharacterized protein n=1 Tax=Pontibacter mangrovi TaxID=2589816 RepID=A0A501W9P2_9BACT|nr:hypothetical protein [Pontibacter mangrovi]TPE45185.1 hypothetical protein FJM65_03865 [Pontibacter mangrovi]
MKQILLLAAVVILVSCGGQQEKAPAVADNPEPVKAEERSEAQFETITFSIFPALGEENISKDVEITADGKFFYRLREVHEVSIKANYTGELDSLDLNEVYNLYSSIDLNHLKQVRYDGFDMAFYSLRITMYNGEVQMKTTLNDDIEKCVRTLLKLIENQNMKKSSNHKFSTAKDVLLPPPGVVYTEAELDSL